MKHYAFCLAGQPESVSSLPQMALIDFPVLACHQMPIDQKKANEAVSLREWVQLCQIELTRIIMGSIKRTWLQHWNMYSDRLKLCFKLYNVCCCGHFVESSNRNNMFSITLSPSALSLSQSTPLEMGEVVSHGGTAQSHLYSVHVPSNTNQFVN